MVQHNQVFASYMQFVTFVTIHSHYYVTLSQFITQTILLQIYTNTQYHEPLLSWTSSIFMDPSAYSLNEDFRSSFTIVVCPRTSQFWCRLQPPRFLPQQPQHFLPFFCSFFCHFGFLFLVQHSIQILFFSCLPTVLVDLDSSFYPRCWLICFPAGQCLS